MKTEQEIVSGMVGRIFVSVTGAKGNEEMRFTDADDRYVVFFHKPDCCERVEIEDIAGDICDLVGTPILRAEVVSSDDAPKLENQDSYTWTFYKFETIKGSVTVRWLGVSNGYYSESVEVLEGP